MPRQLDDFTKRELKILRKVYDDEKWLVSERLGYEVGYDHPEVIANVVEITLRIGQWMRLQAENGIMHSPVRQSGGNP